MDPKYYKLHIRLNLDGGIFANIKGKKAIICLIFAKRSVFPNTVPIY